MPKVRADTSGDSVVRKGKGGNRKQQIVSCLECRRLKWKCDRQFPCGHCRKRGLDSLCPDGQLPSRMDAQDVILSSVNLEQRVKELEAQLEDAQRQLMQYAEGHKPVNASVVPVEEAQLPESPVPAYQVEEDTSMMEPEGGKLTLGHEPGTSSFFGNAGPQYLLDGDEMPVQRRMPLMLADDREVATSTLEDVLRHLPDRHVADRWVDIYFEDASFMNDMISKPCFEALVDTVYSSLPHSGAVDNQQVAIIFLVLAIGAQMDLQLPPYSETAERLHSVARAALDLNPAASIGLVQVVHLMSRYVANSRHGQVVYKSFWTTLGMAVRCAQSVGLHRDGEKWNLEPETVEVRRRIFWEINCEDILQSVTQGRPRLIANSTIDCRFPTVTDASSERVLLHHAKYRLVQIMGMINDQQTRTSPVQYCEILKLHRETQAVERDILPILDGGNATRHSRWQKLYIRLLIQEVYMFLHRIPFGLSLRDSPSEPLTSPYRYSYVCELEASRMVLDILEKALFTQLDLACRFWIWFFHAFTAIINFSVSVTRSPASSLAPAALSLAERGVALLEDLPGDAGAQRDLPTLRRELQKARDAFILQHGHESDPSADYLGIGHRLVRLPPSSNTDSSPTEVLLPTSLAQAVAAQPQDMFQSILPELELPAAGDPAYSLLNEFWPQGEDSLLGLLLPGAPGGSTDLDEFLFGVELGLVGPQ